MKKALAATGIIILLFSLPACYYDNRAEILAQNPTEECPTENLRFASDIEPIIQNSCAKAGCHNAISQTAGLNLESFTDLKNIAVNGSLVGRITATDSRLMPQGGPPLPDCQIKKITAWVQDGAPQN